MKLSRNLFATLVVAALIGACSTTPERVDILEDARMEISDVEQHPDAERVAGDELEDARTALGNAEYLLANNGDYDDIYHQAYLALRHAEIAGERIAEADTREQIENSEAERTRILLAAREAEAARAVARADAREREAAIAEGRAEAAQNLAAVKAAELERKALEAEAADERAQAAIREQFRLQAALREMEAEKTDRGYVLTLSDILFDTDQAVLKPGAESTLDQLAEFLAEYPDRRLLIEGHTDSRGDEPYNLSLSKARANTVRFALIDRGIGVERLEVKALGENYPLATNDTVAGRQRNRRVEVVISDEDGDFPAAAIRTAHTY
jgi:outer membrane protein OmpA-like peptidoglycan-associated protein